MDGVNIIIFALNGQSPRLEKSLLAMITIIRGMFTPLIWDNLTVVFTKVPMDNGSVKRRNKQRPDHDKHSGEGFIQKIKKEFNPVEGCKNIEFLYMDALYNDEEIKALEESKEKLWNILTGNALFKTNKVEEVLTEYHSLKQEIQNRESQIEEQARRLEEYEQRETDRIARDNDETRTPVDGFTFLRFRKFDDRKTHVPKYSEFIEEHCNVKMKQFESADSFSETIDDILNDRDKSVGFMAPQTDLLSSGKLLERIPRKHDQGKVSQLVFILEIKNFTKHFLTGIDIIMEDGNKEPLLAWHTEEDGSDMATPSLLHDFKTFVIPPYAKERLIFRNSGTLKTKTCLQGIMTMNIGNFEATRSERKMMVYFKIDAGILWTSDTIFCVGFPDLDKSTTQVLKMVKSKKRIEKFFEQRIFSKTDTKESFKENQKFEYPTNPAAGEFHLNCMFGNAEHCKGLVIVSQIKK